MSERNAIVDRVCGEPASARLWTTRHCEQVFTARRSIGVLPASAGNMEAAGIEPAFALHHGTSPKGRKPLSHIVTWRKLGITSYRKAAEHGSV